MKNNNVIQTLINQTMSELSAPVRPKSRSRVWTDPKGYQYLGVWPACNAMRSIAGRQNAALLRVLTRKFTLTLPLWEKRLKAQMDDCARSQKRNIEEGWKRPTTSEYLQFLGYAQASLEELKGDIRDCKTDGFIKSKPGSSLLNLGIDLRIFKGAAKGMTKGEPTDLGHPYSQPLSTLKPESLTYEIFIELINKTDFLMRKLVESLEKKLSQEQKYYKIEQARIKAILAK